MGRDNARVKIDQMFVMPLVFSKFQSMLFASLCQSSAVTVLASQDEGLVMTITTFALTRSLARVSMRLFLWPRVVWPLRGTFVFFCPAVS